ncbi:EamA family transporter [Sphingobium sp. B2]|uniref:EamA family transporter n=1 Tax=Sphingobium sp. B2 TaxID=2583228 RepID=UPI0011A80174|nr:EamA family transporter [Sphingobium sp. B2]
MSFVVFGIILFAALLHASWNAIVKGAGDKLLTTVLVTASASVIAVVALPFLPVPARASWPFIAASVVFQVIYFVLVARTYRIADMSLTYPLMRGTAPLIVAVASAVAIGEHLSARAWIGVGIICAGILSMAVSGRHGDGGKGTPLALMSAITIACYTLIDGIGVRRSSAPASYTLWIFLLTGLSLAAWAIATQRASLGVYVRRNWPYGLVGGFGTLASYGLALWAMTVAPVAVVAALRETSILFGTAISAVLLHERVGPARIIAVCIIAAGAATLRLA